MICLCFPLLYPYWRITLGRLLFRILNWETKSCLLTSSSFLFQALRKVTSHWPCPFLSPSPIVPMVPLSLHVLFKLDGNLPIGNQLVVNTAVGLNFFLQSNISLLFFSDSYIPSSFNCSFLFSPISIFFKFFKRVLIYDCYLKSNWYFKDSSVFPIKIVMKTYKRKLKIILKTKKQWLSGIRPRQVSLMT